MKKKTIIMIIIAVLVLGGIAIGIKIPIILAKNIFRNFFAFSKSGTKSIL